MEEIREVTEGRTCEGGIDHGVDSRRGVRVRGGQERRPTSGRRLQRRRGRRSARCGEDFGGRFSPSGSAVEGVCACSSTGWNTPGPHSSHTHWTLSALESSGMHVHTSSSQRIALVFVL